MQNKMMKTATPNEDRERRTMEQRERVAREAAEMAAWQADPAFVAANDRLNVALATSDSVPQPEGKVVVAAYKDGRLADESTMLHLIAVLLRRS